MWTRMKKWGERIENELKRAAWREKWNAFNYFLLFNAKINAHTREMSENSMANQKDKQIEIPF